MTYTYELEEAQESLESLIAGAFNGDEVLVRKGDDLFQILPVDKSLVEKKVWKAEDFYE